MPLPTFSRATRVPALASVGAGLISLVLGLWTENWLSALVVGLFLVLIALVALAIRTQIRNERQDLLVRGLEHRTPTGVPQVSALPSVSLEQRFREALSEMRAHFGGREGVYELPWFLVIGDVGAGKSVFLQECGLDVPARYARRGFGPTESCEFVLANEAIVLDTPGRWFRCATDRDRDDWRKLLELLRRNRPECPLNGVIVAVPVPTLLAQTPSELEEHGRELRRRLNEIRVDLGVDAPIYVALTKADALEGFVETVRPLPASWRQQAMGWTNDQRRLADPAELVERELQALAERLDEFLPELLLRETDPLRQLRIFAYPQELAALARAAATVMGAAFKRDAYDREAPFLRGVYLASSRSEGAALSPTLARLGVHSALGRRGDTPLRGLFLRDLVLEIACGDENLAVPDSRIGPKGRAAIGAAAGLVTAGVLAIWGFSFVQNYQGMRGLSQWADRALLPDPFLEDLSDFRARLASEERNARSPIQWIGFHRLSGAVANGQRTYTWAFRRNFDTLTRDNLVRALDGDDEPAVRSAIAITTDLNFLARRGEDAIAPTLDDYLPQSVPVEKRELYARAYGDFVRWLPESERQELIAGQQAALTKPIAKLLQLPVLERITSNPQGSFPPVRYVDVGLEPATGSSPARFVPGIYTTLGSEKLIQVLLAAVESTPDAVSPTVVADFKRQYGELYTSTWRSFLLDAPLRPRARPDVKGSPYLALLERIDANTRGAAPAEWIEMLRAVRKQEESLTEKIPLPGRDAALKELGPPWAAYLKALEPVQLDVERAAQASEQALAMARDVAEGKDSPFRTSLQTVERIANLVLAGSTDAEAKSKLRQILEAPILDGLSAVLGGAMQELERGWKQKVAGRYPSEQTAAAFKEFRDAALQYVDQDLGPFWRDGKPRRLLGQREMPIGGSAAGWIQNLQTSGAPTDAGTGAVRVRGVPSIIDGPSGLRVMRTLLGFACPETQRPIEYREGNTDETRSWQEGCQEVSLRASVAVPGAQPKELSRVWTGPSALTSFLRAGVTGSDGVTEWRLEEQGGNLAVRVRYRVISRPNPPKLIAKPPAALGS
jgi:hypothetical protein